MEYSPEFWTLNLLFSIPIFLINLCLYVLINFSQFLDKSYNLYVMKYVALQDTIFYFLCILQSSINIAYNTIYGEDTGCTLNYIYTSFFILSTGYSSSLFIYQIKLLSIHKKISEKKLFLYLIGIWIISAILSTINTFTLIQTENCTFILSSGYGFFFYIPGIIFIAVFALYNYIFLYIYMKIGEELKHGLVLFCLITYLIYTLPFIITSILEFNDFYNYTSHIIAIFMIKLNSITNAIIFFSRDEYRSIFSHHIHVYIRRYKVIDKPKPKINTLVDPLLSDNGKKIDINILSPKSNTEIDVTLSPTMKFTTETLYVKTPTLSPKPNIASETVTPISVSPVSILCKHKIFPL